MTVVPGYYIMVLPLLALGWYLLNFDIARRVPARWMTTMMLGGFSLSCR